MKADKICNEIINNISRIVKKNLYQYRFLPEGSFWNFSNKNITFNADWVMGNSYLKINSPKVPNHWKYFLTDGTY